MKKYLKIYIQTVKLAYIGEMTYRASFFLWTIVWGFSVFVDILFFKVVFGDTGLINGWDFSSAMFVVAGQFLFVGFGGLTYFPIMYHFSSEVRNGSLDFVIIKPVDTQLYVSFSGVDVEDTTNIITALIIFLYLFLTVQIPNLLFKVSGAFLMFLIGNIIFYSIIILFQSLAFKYINVEGSTGFIWKIIRFSKYPVTIFQCPVKVIFFTLLPIGIITTIPAQIIMGLFNWNWILLIFPFAIIMLFISRKVFQYGLNRYSSASS